MGDLLFNAVVWKEGWLPHSETFIRDQMLAMPDWNFLKLGLYRTDQPLVEPDFVPFGNNLASKVARKIVGLTFSQEVFHRKIQESKSQLIHAHFLSGGMDASILARKLDLPLITTLHNPRLSFDQTGLPYIYRRMYEKKLKSLLEIGSSYVAISNHVADSALKLGIPSDRIEVLPIGTRIIPKQNCGDRSGIIFVGRLIEIKGILDLIEAMNLLPPSLRDTPLTIVGDGELRDEIIKRAEEFKINVNLLGWKSSTEIPDILAKHQVFCAPSTVSKTGTREGFGMVYLEAALQELPCVAYRSGGVIDAVEDGETGILVKEGDTLELSRALATLLSDDDEARRIGMKGRERVEQKFDIVQQAKKLEQLYFSIS